MAAGTFGLGISATMAMLVFFRIIQGIGFAINGTTCIALATEFMPEGQISQGIGYFTMSNLIATTFGPALGLYLADLLGYRWVFRLAALCPLVAALLVLTVSCRVTDRSAVRPLRMQDLFAPELAPFLLFTGVFSFSNGLINSFLALSAEERGITGYSLFFVIQSLAYFIVRPPAGRLNDRKGLAYVLIPAYFFASVTLILVGTAPNRWALYAAAVIGAFGAGVGSPACQSECVKKIGPARRGVAVSTYYIGADVAQGIAPSLGGSIAEHFGYATMYCGGVVLFAVALIGYLVYHHREKA
jgi:MFS family permease